jgi:hypothetical protein
MTTSVLYYIYRRLTGFSKFDANQSHIKYVYQSIGIEVSFLVPVGIPNGRTE